MGLLLSGCGAVGPKANDAADVAKVVDALIDDVTAARTDSVAEHLASLIEWDVTYTQGAGEKVLRSHGSPQNFEDYCEDYSAWAWQEYITNTYIDFERTASVSGGVATVTGKLEIQYLSNSGPGAVSISPLTVRLVKSGSTWLIDQINARYVGTGIASMSAIGRQVVRSKVQGAIGRMRGTR
jgi:hypothetical protein